MKSPEKFWDRMAQAPAKQGENTIQPYDKSVEDTKKHLNSNDILLDFGCGTGETSTQFAGNVKEIHAIDTSSKVIGIAKRAAAEREIENIHFAQATIFDARYKKESFTVITSFNVLKFIEDLDSVMQRIHDLLKPGGLFISATGCMGEKKTFLTMLLSLLSRIGIVPFMQFYKISELENIITAGNFQIIESEKLPNTQPNSFIVAKKIQ